MCYFAFSIVIEPTHQIATTVNNTHNTQIKLCLPKVVIPDPEHDTWHDKSSNYEGVKQHTTEEIKTQLIQHWNVTQQQTKKC